MDFNIPKIKQPVVLSILVLLPPVYIQYVLYYGCKLQYVRKMMCWEEDCAPLFPSIVSVTIKIVSGHFREPWLPGYPMVTLFVLYDWCLVNVWWIQRTSKRKNS